MQSYLTFRDSPLQDAALRTDMWRPPGVVVEERGRDTPSEDDYMGGKLKTVIAQLLLSLLAPISLFQLVLRHKSVLSLKHASYLRREEKGGGRRIFFPAWSNHSNLAS